MQVLYVRPRFIKRVIIAALVLFTSLLFIGKLAVPGFADTVSTWVNPAAPSLNRIGSISAVQTQPTFLSNLDCTSITYRLTNSGTMNTGCFTPTAYGMLDSDSETVIYNGTDEGVHIVPSSANQLLAPWPNAINVVALDSAATGGSYISLYKNLPLIHQYHDAFGQLSGEQLLNPPDISLVDANGQKVVINPQTMAFSSGGSWLVAEDYIGSFIRINLASLQMTAFAPAFNNPISQKSQVAVSENGRFVAIQNIVNDSFRVYDISTCDNIVHNLAPQHCQSYEYEPFIDHRVSGLQSIQHVRFLNDNLLSFNAASTSQAANGTYELSLTPTNSQTDYLGLGDSYTSGEGAFDYIEATDTSDNKCHLSINSYSMLLTRDLFNSSDGHSVACSGAAIRDLVSDSDGYKGQVKNGMAYSELASTKTLSAIMSGFLPGYIAQQRFVQQYQPKIITVSIGGNDIGFGDILQNCVEPHISLNPSHQNCYNTYESREEILQLVDRTMSRWIGLYRQLQTEDPLSHIYAIGYPSIADSDGKCGLNVHLSQSELRFANQLIAYLNSDIAQAAQSAGVDYVDITNALDGHRLCEASNYDIAVNGLTAGNDIGFGGIEALGHESYHPNALGQQLIEQAILKQTDKLSAELVATQPIINTATDFLNVPKTGGTVYSLIPYDSLANSKVTASTAASIQVNGLDIGLVPNDGYSVRLDGASGPELTSLTSDYDAGLSGTVMIPPVTPVGGHTLDIIGSNSDGEPVDITQPIYVISSSDDSDGDGVQNSADSCPYAINSGIDNDSDGMDDTCDSYIGPLTNKNSASFSDLKQFKTFGKRALINNGVASEITNISSARTLNALPDQLHPNKVQRRNLADVLGVTQIKHLPSTSKRFLGLIRLSDTLHYFLPILLFIICSVLVAHFL